MWRLYPTRITTRYIYYQFRINYKSYERGETEHDKTALLAEAQLKPISLETLSESGHENGNDTNMSPSQWQHRKRTRYELHHGQTGELCVQNG